MNIRRISNYVSRLYDDCLKDSGLTISQYSLLSHLNKLDAPSITELAAAVNLDRTTLVRNLKPLMKAGLIEDLSEEGARNRVLRVTEEGRGTLKSARPMWEEAQKMLVAKIGKEHADILGAIIVELGA